MKKTGPNTLTLVRHGESLLNVVRARSPIFFATTEERDSFRGVADHQVGLSEKGRAQARQTGVAFREAGAIFDSVYDSGYRRTVETLDLILTEFLREPRRVPERKHSLRLRERQSGYSFSLTRAEMEEAFPWFQGYWKTVGPIFARPLGGESVADVVDRVEVFLKYLFEEESGKDVLLVLHGRVLAALRYHLEGWDSERLERFVLHEHPANCGITTYRRGESGVLELQAFNTLYC